MVVRKLPGLSSHHSRLQALAEDGHTKSTYPASSGSRAGENGLADVRNHSYHKRGLSGTIQTHNMISKHVI